MRLRKFWIWLLLPFIILFLALFFIDEPLRQYMERTLNSRLKGYTVRIAALNFHPIGFSLDLKDVLISQDASPIPPVAQIQKLSASIHWKELLRGTIVSDYQIFRPTVFINLTGTEKESKDDVPIEERGFQQAAKRIYPLEVNKFQIIDGDFTYVDQSPLKQIHIKNIYFRAENIKNVESKKNVFPSPVYLEGTIFDSGKILADGHADFLAKPSIGLKSRFAFEQVSLHDLDPLIRRLNIVAQKGLLAGSGEIEYTPDTKVVHLEKITIDQVHADYIYNPQTAPPQKAEQKVKETAQEAATTESNPAVLIEVDEIEIKDGTIGFINKAAHPNYRIFLEKTEFNLKGFSNHLTEGKTEAALKANFMGNGNLGAAALFRPQKKGPDLNLAISIEETELKRMNDLLRAYGDVDVAGGKFSFFMELAVKEGEVNGYVKPLFKEVNVYEKHQDKDKKISSKLYEKAVENVSKLLENKRRDEVATRADLSGRLDDPKASSWEVVVRLIQNAFFKAILPGFEKDAGRSSKK
jgi:hypothetical protein